MQRSIRDFPFVTVVIAVINVVVFLIMEYFGSTLDTGYMLKYGALSYAEAVTQGEYYRFITSMFLHFGFEHLLNNMFLFIVVGYHLESIIGKLRYLFIYISAGVIAGIVSLGYHYFYMRELTVSAGASGAIFGVMGALLITFVFGIGRERVSPSRIVIFLLLTLYNGSKDVEVDAVAHVVGFVVGVVVLFFITVLPTIIKNKTALR